MARIELARGRKILDVALEYGYETASGFTKSFRREFGYSPSIYAARMSGIDFEAVLSKIGGYLMHPVFVKKEAFLVAGYGLPTSLKTNHPREAAAYWDTYTGENLESKMYAQLNPPKHGEVGICVSNDLKDTVYYILGVIVENFDRVTPDMMTVEVPTAEYAVFTTPEVDLTQITEGEEDSLALVVKATWKYILEEWFPKSGFQYDESKIGFEFYDERCHNRPDSTMDIYVPVVPKQ